MDSGRLASLWLILALAAALQSCAAKGIVKPRSQMIEESLSAGLRVPSMEEDRETFFKTEEVQKKRLLALVRKRSSSQYRDLNYKVGPEDEVEVNVFDVPELNVTAKVKQSGFISLPLIGAVKAAGLNESDLHDEIKRRLLTYVRQPEVSVFVSHYGSHKVSVLGAVSKPGQYALTKGANSLLQLIGEAGGISDKAGNLLLFIPSELSGLSSANDVEARARLALVSQDTSKNRDSGIEIYLDQVMGTAGGIPLEIPVRGGDMVVIPEAGKVMIEGEVSKPGSFDLTPQFTLLSALAAAGGITYAAKVDEVEIVREAAFSEKTRLVLDLEKLGTGEEKDVRLRNGDIVRVPSDPSRRLTQDTFEGISRVINLGIGGNVNLIK